MKGNVTTSGAVAGYRRSSIRLRDYDYAGAGAYFITICAWQRQCLFGEIVDGVMMLHGMGRIVADEWEKTATIRKNVDLDEYIVMPNHFHAIVFLSGNDDGRSDGRGGRTPDSRICPDMVPNGHGGCTRDSRIFSDIVPNGHGARRGDPAGRPLTPAGRPLTPAGRPISPAGRPLTPAGRPISPAGRPLTPADRPFAAPKGPQPGSIGAIMAQFKSVVTKRINAMRGSAGAPVWQRNYYERVIRDENELSRARQYIVNNPMQWELALDRENPAYCRGNEK